MSDLRTVEHGTSGALLARILDMYAPDATSILDATWGHGAMWADSPYRPLVISADRDPDRAIHVVADVTALPFRDRSIDVVVFDPPHLADSGQQSIMGARYGSVAGESALRALVARGMVEGARVARQLLVAKLANYTHGGKPWRLTDWASGAIRRYERAMVGPWEIVLTRPSPVGRDPKWKRQRTPRCVDSRWLIWTAKPATQRGTA